MSQVIIENLKNYMQKRSINSRELAKRAEVKPSFIYDILSGKSTNPSSVKLSQVARALAVTLSDLVEVAELQSDNDNFAPAHHYQPSTPTSHDQPLPLPDETAHKHGMAEQVYPFTYFNAEWLKQHTSTTPEAMQFLKIEDDAMAPTLCKGDLVMLDRSQTSPSPPGLFVLRDAYGTSVKRVALHANGQGKSLRLSCDNPHYGFSQCTAKDAEIVGRVVWVSKWV